MAREHESADKRFRKDSSAVTVFAFARRVASVLNQMCQSNESSKTRRDKESELQALVRDEYGEEDILMLVHNLLVWDDTTRSVGIVALVIMDRVQTRPRGFAVTFENVGKIFAACFLLAKKFLDDNEV